MSERVGATVLSTSRHDTLVIGQRLGQLLQAGDVICLQGELGSGKTCLTQGIAAGLGVARPVTSPTFIIVNEYALAGKRHMLYHIDLYRVESVAEACATGLEEYWSGDDVCVIEWAERARSLLPPEHLWITLLYRGEGLRELQFEALGARPAEMLRGLAGVFDEVGGRPESRPEVPACS